MAWKLTSPELSENDVERQCLAICARRNYWQAKLHAGRFQTVDGRWITGVPKGTPDYTVQHAYYPGFLLEVKRPGAKTSPDQDCRRFEIVAQYHLAVCVVDNDWKFVEWLDRHERAAREMWGRLLAGTPVVPPMRGP